MEYLPILENDYNVFHPLLNMYYRDGEDANTPQEEIDAFIRFLFNKVSTHEIEGVFVNDGNANIGFCLWAIDTEGFEFSQKPGFGTILEIGFAPLYRASGHGKQLVTYIESCMHRRNVNQCYVSAYGPAQSFWEHCGYMPNEETAGNGLPILVKKIV